MSKFLKFFVVSGFLVFAVFLAQGLSAQSTTSTSPAPTSSTSPATVVNPQPTSCSAGQEVCWSSDQKYSWCSSSPCTETTCNAKAGYEWCKPDPSWSSGQGWCNSVKGSCPIYDSTACVVAGKKWCAPDPNMTMTASTTGAAATVSKGYCTYNATDSCPVYNETDCAAQNGKWCKNAPPPAGSTSYYSDGWCAKNMGATNYECPIYEEKTCLGKGRTWCKDTWGGSCMTSSSDWCSGTKVYPNSLNNGTPGGVPVPSPTPSYFTCPGGLMNMDGTCAQSTPSPWPSPKPSILPIITPKPPVLIDPPKPLPLPSVGEWEWPNSPSECDYYKGKWCEYADNVYTAPAAMTPMVNGYCKMGTEECEPKDKKECAFKGRHWCEYETTPGNASHGGSNGWCSYETCEKYAKPAMIVCPDGVTDAKSIKDCPNIGGKAPEMTSEWDWNNKKEVCDYYKGNWCPTSNWDGGASGYCNKGTRECEPRTEKKCLEKTGKYWCKNSAYASGYKSAGEQDGWCSNYKCYEPVPWDMITCPDGLTHKKKLKDCPTTGGALPEKCPLNMIKDTATMKCVPWPSPFPWPTVKPTPSPWPEPCAVGTMRDPGSMKCVPLPTPPPKKDKDFGEKDLKWRELEMKYLTLDLESLEKDFKTYEDTVSLKLIVELRLKVEALPKDQSMYDLVKSLQQEVKNLRAKRTELKNKKKTENQKKTDERRRENLLKNIKTSSERYYKRVTETLEALSTFENVGGTAPESLKQKLRDMKASLETIKETTSYETARDLMRELNSLDILDVFDEYVLEISVLPELPRVMRDMDTNLAEMDTQLDAARTLLEDQDFDTESLLSDVEAKLSKIRTTYESLKGLVFSVSEDDEMEVSDYRSFKEWVKMTLTMPLLSISADLRELKQLSRVRTYIGEANSDLVKYRKDVKKLKGKAKARGTTLLNVFDSELKSLDRQLKKLKKDDLPNLLPQIEKVANARYAVQVFLKKKTAEVAFRQKLDDLIKKLDEEEKEDTKETANLPTLKSLVEETLKVE